MTPKEKAFSLYFKFIRDIIADNEKAKQCALIAVDECIESLHEHHWQNRLIIDYYEEVKQEIEKL
jgi:hypothetical protein